MHTRRDREAKQIRMRKSYCSNRTVHTAGNEQCMTQQATKWDLAPFFHIASCVASSMHGAWVACLRKYKELSTSIQRRVEAWPWEKSHEKHRNEFRKELEMNSKWFHSQSRNGKESYCSTMTTSTREWLPWLWQRGQKQPNNKANAHVNIQLNWEFTHKFTLVHTCQHKGYSRHRLPRRLRWLIWRRWTE